MSMTYIIVAFATVLLNNVFLSLFSFKVRIIFGYAISLTTLVFVALCEVAWHMFTAQTAYSVNLVAVSLTAVGCTGNLHVGCVGCRYAEPTIKWFIMCFPVQQSSFYGFASMFPKKYTQAVMAGESKFAALKASPSLCCVNCSPFSFVIISPFEIGLAGLLVASTRISIKLVISSDELSTVIFFLTSTTYIALSYVLHSTTVHSPFVRYHMKACSKIVLRPDEDRVLVRECDFRRFSPIHPLNVIRILLFPVWYGGRLGCYQIWNLIDNATVIASQSQSPQSALFTNSIERGNRCQHSAHHWPQLLQSSLRTLEPKRWRKYFGWTHESEWDNSTIDTNTAAFAFNKWRDAECCIQSGTCSGTGLRWRQSTLR